MGEILLTAAAVFGLALAGVWLLGRALRPLPAPGARVVIPGRGDGQGIEAAVRSFQWLRGLGLLCCPIVIADLDLTPAGRALALGVARRWPGVTLWPAALLHEQMDIP